MYDIKKNHINKIKNIIENSPSKDSMKTLLLELIDHEDMIGRMHQDLRSFKDDYMKMIDKAISDKNDH